jgi:hypothetical protein
MLFGWLRGSTAPNVTNDEFPFLVTIGRHGLPPFKTTVSAETARKVTACINQSPVSKQTETG